MRFLDKIFGDVSSRFIKETKEILTKINELEKSFSVLSDAELTAKTEDFKKRINLTEQKENLDDILPEAFAVVREAAKRTLDQRHFDVQLIGGIAMHRGNIAEMKTGEGKTLVATLPAYLNALVGCGVHIVTVNDYLAKRDAVWMGKIYHALGLSVAVIIHEKSFLYDPALKINLQETNYEEEKEEFKIAYEFLKPCSRQEAYTADITYGTNSEFGFDYLRDNLEYDPRNIRQINHQFAIIDEIDSILIDEARTPLIISAPAEDSDLLYHKFAQIAEELHLEEHYSVDEKMRSVLINDAGINKAENLLKQDIYGENGVKMAHHLEVALKAKALYLRDKDYVVKEGEIIIVDPFTGRLQPGRRWSEGLHQAIEAKEGVKIEKESRTFASITYQNYFRMYKKLSGMTGTAITSAEEFYKVYGLDVIAIPSNKNSQRFDGDDFIFQTRKGKYLAVAKKVKELQAKGQPVLIGTISIEDNEVLSDYLKREGVIYEVLNAKNHEREAEIIAQAGKKNAVTIATNMAGRGVDIKLGGNPATEEEYEIVKNCGGLFVIGTERHDARRIDNQLRGRSGRQGDPGQTKFFVSMEDHIMRVFAADMVKKMMGRLGIPEDQPIENSLITKSLESAQEKIEGLNFDARKHILEYDDVINFQRKTFYERRRKILEEEKNERTKQLKLQIYDMFWVNHLETMDYLRGSVNLRAYGQRDPLVEYKKEGLRLFKEMEQNIENTIEENLKKLEDFKNISSEQSEVQRQAEKITNSQIPPLGQGKGTETDPRAKNLGRNDPCWCGSGKKFKKCHGASS